MDLSLTHSHSLPITLTASLTHSFTNTHTHTHTRTHTRTHAHTHTHTHTHTAFSIVLRELADKQPHIAEGPMHLPFSSAAPLQTAQCPISNPAHQHPLMFYWSLFSDLPLIYALNYPPVVSNLSNGETIDHPSTTGS